MGIFAKRGKPMTIANNSAARRRAQEMDADVRTYRQLVITNAPSRLTLSQVQHRGVESVGLDLDRCTPAPAGTFRRRYTSDNTPLIGRMRCDDRRQIARRFFKRRLLACCESPPPPHSTRPRQAPGSNALKRRDSQSARLSAKSPHSQLISWHQKELPLRLSRYRVLMR